MRIARLFLIALMTLGFAACDVGSGGDGDGDIDNGGTTVDEILLCAATLNVEGSLAPAGDPPGPDDGCVPEGVWTLNVTIDDPGDCADDDIIFNAQYQYEISRDAEEQLVMTYLGEDAGPDDAMKPSSSGGTCRANIEHFAPDGSWWLMLKPFEDDLVVTGYGEFELYDVM